MGECILDRYGKDGFQSCEGFDDWSTFSSTDLTEPEQDDSGFSDWGAFQDNTGKEESSTLLEEEAGTFKSPKNVCYVVLHIFSVVACLNSFTVLKVTCFQTVAPVLLWYLIRVFHRLKMAKRGIPGSFLTTAFKLREMRMTLP